MNQHQSEKLMKNQSLAITSLILVLALAIFVLLQSPKQAQVNTNEALVSELSEINGNLSELTETVQRLNTSVIQYDFLKGQLEALSATDRNIVLRAQATNNAKNEENKENVEKIIAQLTNLSKQVKGAQKDRNATMLKLINGLERQLAAIKIEDTPTVPTATPAGKNTRYFCWRVRCFFVKYDPIPLSAQARTSTLEHLNLFDERNIFLKR